MRARVLAVIALSQATFGDATAARASIADALGGDQAAMPRDDRVAGSLAGTWARLGEDERALAAARASAGTQHPFALIVVASAGPRGRVDAAPERAWAELRTWTAPQRGPGEELAPVVVSSMVRLQVRYGESDDVLARIATIRDPAWRARALLMAAGELAATPRADLAARALRDAEALLGPEPASAAGAPAEGMRSVALPWLPYAYARLGDARAEAAFAAVLEGAGRTEPRSQRLFAYATIVSVINATRLHIAEQRAGTAAPGAALRR
jgi:hypothetical protein